MTILQAALLGLVEGITEYLPVSSTGHLILAQRALGIPSSEEANAFAIVIQGGAILAVLGLYARRVLSMARGVLGHDDDGRKLAINLIIAFVPAAIIGKLFDDAIEAALFGLWPVVAAWTVGGVVILALSGRIQAGTIGGRAALESLSAKQALIIGLCQCLAMWPGTSRSFATLLAGVLVGLSVPAAVEFSFLLGVLTLGAATAYKALQLGPEMLNAYGPAPIAVGCFTAWLSAVLAVKWMVGWLSRRSLAVFGWWRLAVAAGTVVALALGMQP